MWDAWPFFISTSPSSLVPLVLCVNLLQTRKDDITARWDGVILDLYRNSKSWTFSKYWKDARRKQVWIDLNRSQSKFAHEVSSLNIH